MQSPSGIVEDYSISNLGNFLYRLMFVPQEMGVYTITVQCLDKYTTDIRGSPFLFTVGLFRTRGANRVHAGGPGLVGGNSNEPCKYKNVNLFEINFGSFVDILKFIVKEFKLNSNYLKHRFY